MKVSNKRARLLTGLRRFSQNNWLRKTHLKSLPFDFINKRGPWCFDIEFVGYTEFSDGVIAFANQLYDKLLPKVVFLPENPNTKSERLDFSQFLNTQH